MTSCLSENLRWQFYFMLSKSHLVEMLIFVDKNSWDLGLVEKDNNYIHSLEKSTHHYPQITMTITLLGPFNKKMHWIWRHSKPQNNDVPPFGSPNTASLYWRDPRWSHNFCRAPSLELKKGHIFLLCNVSVYIIYIMVSIYRYTMVLILLEFQGDRQLTEKVGLPFLGPQLLLSNPSSDCSADFKFTWIQEC